MNIAGQDRSGVGFRVALVSMPWPIFNRPSVQLGTLKAFLETADKAIRVDSLHPYLEVAKILGFKQYVAISQNIWISEALYGAICFPEQIACQKRLVAAQLRKIGLPNLFDFDEVLRKLITHLVAWAGKVDWSRYDLIGFSVCFSQLLPTLAAVRTIKSLYPRIPVVLGGSICAPEVAASLLNTFPVFDYIISGEGELSLLQLCQVMAKTRANLPAGILHKDVIIGQADANSTCGNQIDDPKRLPVPDYRDYFLELKRNFPEEPFIPELPVEFSRGCWWGKCSFCNLNLQWSGYRAKQAVQMADEIEELASRHGSLDFSFTDNVLPVAQANIFFEQMARGGRDYSFFAEIRVEQRGEKLAGMANGGLKSAQAGIEALSDTLLKRLGKGATVLENIALMRDAQEAGVALDGNLIIEFPASTDEDVAETLSALEFVMPYRPLATAAFFLGHGSPVDKNPKAYGIRSVLHPNNREIFPAEVLAGLRFLINGWSGDQQYQKKIWQPVVDRVRAWSEFHSTRSAVTIPPLSYRDGGNFLIIRQEYPGRAVLHHRLRGLSRAIYLECRNGESLTELKKRYPTQNSERLQAFLDDLVHKKLLFASGEKYLALAVHWNRG